MRRLLLLLCLAVPGPAPACAVRALAAVPVTRANGDLTVPVEVNGAAARFILDTGAERSVVSPDAARRLGLARDPWVGTSMSGVGGTEHRPNANPRSLALGGVPLLRRTVGGDTSLAVTDLPAAPGTEGLLGRDYLSRFDLDLDVPALRLTLYAVQGCSARFLPWEGGYAGGPFDSPAARAVVLAVRLDGVPLRAMLDTGATASVLAAPGMARMRLTEAALAADPAVAITGAGPRTVAMRRHAFKELDSVGAPMPRPLLLVAPIRLVPVADMLLGADWLQGRRVWLSFATGQLFVAGAGSR